MFHFKILILREIRKKKRDEIKDIHQQENHFYFIFFEMMMGASEIFFFFKKRFLNMSYICKYVTKHYFFKIYIFK